MAHETRVEITSFLFYGCKFAINFRHSILFCTKTKKIAEKPRRHPSAHGFPPFISPQYYFLQCIDFLCRQAGNRHYFLHFVTFAFHALCCLHQALVDGGLGFSLLVLFPFRPVDLAQIPLHLFKQRAKVVFDDIANLTFLKSCSNRGQGCCACS